MFVSLTIAVKWPSNTHKLQLSLQVRELGHCDGGEPNIQERQTYPELIKLFWREQGRVLLNIFRD